MTSTFKLSTDHIINLQRALGALDGRDKAVKDGERYHVVREPYTFGKGLRFAIAKNIAALQAHTEAYDKLRRGLIAKVSGGMSRVDEDDPMQMKEFTETSAMFLAELHTVDLVQITEEELKLDTNPIPGTVIAGLSVLIDGMVPEPVTAELANGHAAEATIN